MREVVKSLISIGFVALKFVGAASLATSMSVFLVGLRLARESKNRETLLVAEASERLPKSVAA